MTFPFFYIPEFDASQKEIILDEDTSRHIVQVLRMNGGEKINLTDGKGNLITCEILEAHKKHCKVEVRETDNQKPAARNITIAISLIKNTSRFEWFLEKATEIGVSEIIPLICERTEKEKFRFDRMNAILISAMLQSQQCWLPKLQEPIAFNKIINYAPHDQKLIAHCAEGNKSLIHNLPIGTSAPCLICIGPEGDFSTGEIESALQYHFTPVSLGATRLRTETAGIVAATLLCIY
ncbi:MAG TPA: 16S rRNA (uracil(1498)-N(3))-methyltransferase [Chitinophagaceae bacterium]|nr:16S rRNA (uracil(1498)-N(3))-methyltransferase [Chitinophagaceae bacterium]